MARRRRRGYAVTSTSVQSIRIGVVATEAGVVRLPNAEHRAVLEVMGTASPIEEDARQEAVLAGCAAVLSSLSYPIQILVRAAPVDVARYVATLEERARRGLPGELASLAHDH